MLAVVKHLVFFLSVTCQVVRFVRFGQLCEYKAVLGEASHTAYTEVDPTASSRRPVSNTTVTESPVVVTGRPSPGNSSSVPDEGTVGAILRHADDYSDGVRRAADREALVIEPTTVQHTSNAWRGDGREVAPPNDIECWDRA